MSKFKYAGWVIAFIFLAFIVFKDGCWKKTHQAAPEVVKTDTVITYDTIRNSIYIPYEKLRYVIQFDTVPHSIDTVSILKDLFSKRIYDNEYTLDSFLSLKISDTVSRNMIQGRGIEYIFRQKNTTVTNSLMVYRRKVLVGASLVSDISAPNMHIFITGSYMTKQDAILSVGYNPFSSSVMIGVQRKISFRK